MAESRFYLCPLDEGRQPGNGIQPVLFLAAEASGGQDDLTLLAGSAAGQFQQARLDLLWQPAGPGRVEAQLYGGGQFVDILTAWTR